MLLYSSLFVIQFCLGESVCLGAVLVVILRGDGVLCLVHGSHLFVLSNDEQAGLEMTEVAAVVRNGSKFSQHNMHGEAFHGLGVQDVKSLILVYALFLLDEGRRREGKK
jgi:hypothetical protein